MRKVINMDDDEEREDEDEEDWRNYHATESQKKRLLNDGFSFSPNITRGEASDLIGRKLDPSAEEIGILKYFKINEILGLSQTDARRIIREIFSESANRDLWEEYEDEFWEREDWIEFFFDEINQPDTLEFYEYKEISKQLFMQVMEEFESKGMTKDMISNDVEAFIERALAISPQLRNIK